MTSPTNSQNVKYLAINAARSPRIYIFEYTPNSSNWRGFQLLDEAYVPSTKKWYKLLSLAGNQADWQLQASDANDFISEVVTDAGTATPTNNSINLLGTQGISTSAVNNTILIANDSVNTLTSDAGTATASVNNINIVGGADISTSAVGDTITIDFTGSTLLNVDTNAGTATVAGNTLEIFGCTGLQTSGAANIVSITANNTNHAPIVGTGTGFSNTAAGATGEIFIGSTGTDPKWKTAGATGEIFIGSTGNDPKWKTAGTTGQVLMGSTGADPVYNTIPTGVPYWNSPMVPDTFITSSYTQVETKTGAPGTLTFTWTPPALPAGQEMYAVYFSVIVNSSNFAGSGTYSLIVRHNVVSLMSVYAASLIATNITQLANHQTNNGYTSTLTLTGAANNAITVSCTNLAVGNTISISARYMGGSFGYF